MLLAPHGAGLSRRERVHGRGDARGAFLVSVPLRRLLRDCALLIKAAVEPIAFPLPPQVLVDHEVNQLLEARLWLSAKHGARLRWGADAQVDLGRLVEGRINHDMSFAVIDPDTAEDAFATSAREECVLPVAIT